MRGIVKAASITDAIRHGLDNGIEVLPIRKGQHGTEWHCNLNALCVEDVHQWYTSEKYTKAENGSYPMGTLLFFDFGEFSKGV